MQEEKIGREWEAFREDDSEGGEPHPEERENEEWNYYSIIPSLVSLNTSQLENDQHIFGNYFSSVKLFSLTITITFDEGCLLSLHVLWSLLRSQSNLEEVECNGMDGHCTDDRERKRWEECD